MDESELDESRVGRKQGWTKAGWKKSGWTKMNWTKSGSTACNICTKFTKSVLQHWRALGMQVVLHLDDGIVTHQNATKLVQLGSQIRPDLFYRAIMVNK